MYQQLYEHFNSIISQKQCGSRKGYSAQCCLMVMLEKFRESRDKGEESRYFSFSDVNFKQIFMSIQRLIIVCRLNFSNPVLKFPNRP